MGTIKLTVTTASDAPGLHEQLRTVAPLRAAKSAARSPGDRLEGIAISCAAASAAASAAVWALALPCAARIRSTSARQRIPTRKSTAAANTLTDPASSARTRSATFRRASDRGRLIPYPGASSGLLAHRPGSRQIDAGGEQPLHQRDCHARVVGHLNVGRRPDSTLTGDADLDSSRIEAGGGVQDRLGDGRIVRRDRRLAGPGPRRSDDDELVLHEETHLDQCERHGEDEGKDQRELDRRRAPLPRPTATDGDRSPTPRCW